MENSVFTKNDFLKAVDLINQSNGNFGIWFETQDHNSFDNRFSGINGKRKAKQILYNLH